MHFNYLLAMAVKVILQNNIQWYNIVHWHVCRFSSSFPNREKKRVFYYIFFPSYFSVDTFTHGKLKNNYPTSILNKLYQLYSIFFPMHK